MNKWEAVESALTTLESAAESVKTAYQSAAQEQDYKTASKFQIQHEAMTGKIGQLRRFVSKRKTR